MSLIPSVNTSKLVVGVDFLPPVTPGAGSGSAFINGPLSVGSPVAAVGMVNVVLPSIAANASALLQNLAGINVVAPATGLLVTAPTNIINGMVTINGMEIVNGTSITNGSEIANGLKVNNSVKITNSTGIVNGPLIVNGPITAPVLNGYATGNKPLWAFDIPHWKDKNKRVRHLCAEGPEAGIYVRGKLEGKNTIDLPEYWDGLVDIDTLTVTLTAYKRPQNLYVKEVQYGRRVVIATEDGSMPCCYYEMWVARWIDPRNHDEKLHVVYDGKTPDEYPGDPKNFLVGGWDHDKRIPQWYPDSHEGGTPD